MVLERERDPHVGRPPRHFPNSLHRTLPSAQIRRVEALVVRRRALEGRVHRDLVFVFAEARPRGEDLDQVDSEVGGHLQDRAHHHEVVLALLHVPAGEVRHALDGAQSDPLIGGHGLDARAVGPSQVERRCDWPLRFDGKPLEPELPGLTDLLFERERLALVEQPGIRDGEQREFHEMCLLAPRARSASGYYSRGARSSNLAAAVWLGHE
jgi:hypothetical protein